MDERLERFRACIARVNPAGKPKEDIDRGLYIEPPGTGVGRQLAARIQLAPLRPRVVVGGIGTGKTTEMLIAAAEISRGDTLGIYVDVSLRHRIDKPRSGVLLALAALEVASRIPESSVDANVQRQKEYLNEWANGYFDYGDEPPDQYEPPFIDGVLSSPDSPLPHAMAVQVERLKGFQALVGVPRVVMLFDSLDRISDLKSLHRLLYDDLRALALAGIGCVIVAPSRTLYAENREILDMFEGIHVQPALDVERDAIARRFLEQLLAARLAPDFAAPEEIAAITLASGGILRDAVSLAQLAVENAFAAGRDALLSDDVVVAVEQFGHQFVTGLRAPELEKLRRIDAFVPVDDSDFALLRSRRIVEYSGVPSRYAVHPTLRPILKKMAGPT